MAFDGFLFGGDLAIKLAVFLLVQALVYLILSESSNVFSADNKMRSLSFRPARAVSIRRMLALISDLPAGDETSPPIDNASTRKASASDYYFPSMHWIEPCLCNICIYEEDLLWIILEVVYLFSHWYCHWIVIVSLTKSALFLSLLQLHYTHCNLYSFYFLTVNYLETNKWETCAMLGKIWRYLFLKKVLANHQLNFPIMPLWKKYD